MNRYFFIGSKKKTRVATWKAIIEDLQTMDRRREKREREFKLEMDRNIRNLRKERSK